MKRPDTNTWGMTARKRRRLKTAARGSQRQHQRRQWKADQ